MRTASAYIRRDYTGERQSEISAAWAEKDRKARAKALQLAQKASFLQRVRRFIWNAFEI